MNNTKLKSPPTGNQNLPRRNRRRLAALALAAVVLAGFAAGTGQVQAQEKTKVIYFLPGLLDHRAGPGRHEVLKDMLVLQDCMKQAANLKGVKIVAKYIESRTNLDVSDIKDADALIVECSALESSQFRTHPLFPPLPRGTTTYDEATMKYLDDLDKLHTAGMGIMILHWGIAVNANQYPQVRDLYVKWFGQTAGRGTQNPLGNWIVTPIESGKKHPIMSGVNKWIYKDEIFSGLPVANQDDPNRTDLLTGESPQTNQNEPGSPPGVIRPRLIAAAYEKGKARGILWGGMDFHSSFLNENYLRFVLNAITWTAGIDVPEGGVKTNAKQLQLAPPSRQFSQQIKPEGFVDAVLPEGMTIP